MPLTFQGYRPRPWKLALRDPLAGTINVRFFASEAEARQAEGDEAALLAREKVLLRSVRAPRKARPGITVGDLVAAYLDTNHLRPITIKTTRSHLSPMLRLFRQRAVHTLGADEMRIFAECQKLRGVGRTTIALRLSRFIAAVKWGVATGRLRKMPPIQIRLPHGRSRRVAPPTARELAKLVETPAAAHVRRVVLCDGRMSTSRRASCGCPTRPKAAEARRATSPSIRSLLRFCPPGGSATRSRAVRGSSTGGDDRFAALPPPGRRSSVGRALPASSGLTTCAMLSPHMPWPVEPTSARWPRSWVIRVRP